MTHRVFYMDDCTVSLPTGFADRTVNVLEWRATDGEPVALIVQRQPLPLPPDEPPEEAFARFVDRQVKDYASQFDGFHGERDETAVGAPFEVRRVAFRWRKDREVLYHHQAFVLAGAGVLLFTASAKARRRDAVDALIEEIISSLRARGD